MISVIVTLSPPNHYTSGRLSAPAAQDKEQTSDLDKYLVCDMELLGPPYVAQINLDHAV